MEWHHLVYTFDGMTTRVYSDGALQNSEALGPGVINTHPDTRITVASQLEADGVTLTPAAQYFYDLLVRYGLELSRAGSESDGARKPRQARDRHA